MKKMKILLVDDEKEFVETLSERMKIRNLPSDIALDGEQALQKVEEETPDVILLDLKMPGIDGMEVLRRMVYAFYAEDFSFASFVRANPEQTNTLVHLLIGNVYRVPVDGLIAAMEAFSPLPSYEPLCLNER